MQIANYSSKENQVYVYRPRLPTLYNEPSGRIFSRIVLELLQNESLQRDELTDNPSSSVSLLLTLVLVLLSLSVCLLQRSVLS